MHRVGVLRRGYAASASADWDASQLGMELVTGEGGGNQIWYAADTR